ncbi:phosphatase PAP2 family protein [Aequorivita capsosiphonis]|uniref:phosphatase PAP2 family protein n=1 Tax=Aequorivita capsosiphonis TaxID=487317 RepID=UPI001FDF07D4|nr:phosphatase PAP2 family protein [Aequorivita capsosiphonis]
MDSIIYFILYSYRFKKGIVVAFFLLLTVVVTMLFTDMVKDYVARLRPNNVEVLGELIRILQKPSNYSFFSGHASSSFSIATFIVLMLRKFSKWIYLIYLWPLIFVMSRIFIGVHYPSDIFVGALVGTSFAWIFVIFCYKTLASKSLFKS